MLFHLLVPDVGVRPNLVDMSVSHTPTVEDFLQLIAPRCDIFIHWTRFLCCLCNIYLGASLWLVRSHFLTVASFHTWFISLREKKKYHTCFSFPFHFSALYNHEKSIVLFLFFSCISDTTHQEIEVLHVPAWQFCFHHSASLLWSRPLRQNMVRFNSGRLKSGHRLCNRSVAGIKCRGYF